MFIEPQRNIKTGWIEVICGSMFSGKTEELIRRLKRAIIAKQKVEIFKPSIDTRYDENDVVSHNSNSIASTPVTNAQSILLLSNDIDVVGIDEAQFFDDQLPQVCQVLANKGIRVIIAGLDMDFKGQPFGTMPALLAMAEYVTKVNAICMKCGGIASHSFRLINEDATVLLGEKESYEPRCRKCFNEGIREEMFND
ncbi:MAG: thymidine kinase [Bacteroidetes bacterium]|jgi:thymidine kinase|nr:thymidine kinase [Bacteroidota bacterium]MBP7256597.1 thymidine kinase [Chitinophagales bacterium]MBK7139829.1 thymidine kinase [Bacteroidota bacterium]MBK7640929.1 thymidine kinase [Bacteroidota bacterium]MBK8674368.1 thymidine kinase [Bacteroidota bacterium]